MSLAFIQFATLYPSLALFAKEKGWRCGKSFISHRSKCYTNPKTGQKLGYKFELNPKTGRKRKVRIGLNYKEYQKARSKALKKRGQGKRLTSLEQKYIADVDRLAASTRKKKQRALDAKNKRLAAKGDRNTGKSKVTIPNYLGGADGNKRLSESLKAKLEEFETKGIPAFTILETEGRRDKQTLFALNKKGEATVYRSKRKPRYDGTDGAEYDWVESKYLHANKQRKTLAKRTSSLFTPKAEQLDRVAYNQSFYKLKDKEFAEIEAKKEARVKQKELEEATRLQANRKRSAYRDYLESGAKSLRGTKKEIEIPFSVFKEDKGKRVLENRKISATVYGSNGDLALHRSVTPSGAEGDLVLTHTKSGAKIINPFNQREAKELSFAILAANPNLDQDAIDKFAPEDLSKISTAIASVRGDTPTDFDPDNPPAIKNFNPVKKTRSKSKTTEYKPSSLKYQDLSEQNQILYDGAKKKIKGFDDNRVLATIEAIAQVNGEDIKKGVNLATVAEAIQHETAGGVKNSINPEGQDRINQLSQILDQKKIGKLGQPDSLEQQKKRKLAHRKINNKVKPRDTTDYLSRRSSLDPQSNDKAVEILANSMANSSFERELRTSTAELIDESKKKKIDNIGDRIAATLEKSGISREEEVKRGYGSLSLKDTTTKPKRGDTVYLVKSPADKVSDRVAKLSERFTLKKVNKKGGAVELIDKNNKPVTASIEEVYPQRYRTNPEYLSLMDNIYAEVENNQKSLLAKQSDDLLTKRPGKLTSNEEILKRNKRKDKTATYSNSTNHSQFSVLYPNLACFSTTTDTNIYGIWWSNRTTPTVVNARSSNEARTKGRRKYKSGYGSIAKVALLSKSDAAKARKGEWVTTRANGKSRENSSKSSSYRPWLSENQEYNNLAMFGDCGCISKDDRVSWKWGTGKAFGKVLKLYDRTVTRTLNGSKITRKGTKENPALLIKQQDGSKILKLKSEVEQDRSAQFSETISYQRRTPKGKLALVRRKKTNKRRNLIRHGATLAGILGATGVAIALTKKPKAISQVAVAKKVTPSSAPYKPNPKAKKALDNAKDLLRYSKTGQASPKVKQQLNEIARNLENPNYKWVF